MQRSDLISKYFTLGDFIGDQEIPDAATIQNFRRVGVVLDLIRDQIGPFALTSLYRSPQKQAGMILAARLQAAPNSLHTTGEAADITPTSMSLPTFFAHLMQNAAIRALIGQAAVKNTTLHFSVTTPQFPTFTPMYVAKNGQYYRFEGAQLQDYLKSGYKPDPTVLLADATLPQPEPYTEVEPLEAGFPKPLIYLGLGVMAMAVVMRLRRGHE